MRTFLTAMLTLAATAAAAAPAARLAAIGRAPLPARQALVDSLLAAAPTNPLAAGDTLILLYSGSGQDVRLAGDWTGWQPRPLPSHLPGTDLWTARLVFPPRARVDYKYVIDGDWRLDPRDPFTCVGGFGPNSELRGTGYREPAFMTDPPAALCPHERFTIDAPGLGGPREVVLLTPCGEPPAPRPLLLVHDGLEYVSLAHLDRLLVWLTSHRPDVAWPICVCVPPGERTEEYAGSRLDDFGAWIAGTLVPAIRDRTGAGGKWGTLGASYGGNVSLYLARRYPELFDRVAAMSPYVAPEQRAAFVSLPADSLRIYLNHGTYDLAQLIPMDRDFAALLESRGFTHLTEELPQGHSWGFWRDTLPAALTFLYAANPKHD